MPWPKKKIHTRNLITKKNYCGSKIPLPPNNFSNGPSLIVQSYFDTLLRCVLSATFCGAVVSVKVMDQNFNDTLSAEEVITCVKLCIYKHLDSLPDTSSQIFHWKLARHSVSLFDRNKTQPQTSKASEKRLASHQQNDGRLQKFADNQSLC